MSLSSGQLLRVLIFLAIGAAIIAVARPEEAVASESPVDLEVCTDEDPDFGIHSHPLDIEEVTVTRNPDGEISFRVVFTEVFELEPDMGFLIAIDADADVTSGDPDGDEFLLEYIEAAAGSQPVLVAWQGVDWLEIPSRSLTFSHQDDQVSFTIAESEFGEPSHFAYWLFAGTNWTTQEADVDVALQREHVVVSADQPEKWTFPSCGTITVPGDGGGGGEDDGLGLAVIGLVIFGLFALGGLAGIGGWLYERYHRREQANAPPSALESVSASEKRRSTLAVSTEPLPYQLDSKWTRGSGSAGKPEGRGARGPR